MIPVNSLIVSISLPPCILHTKQGTLQIPSWCWSPTWASSALGTQLFAPLLPESWVRSLDPVSSTHCHGPWLWPSDPEPPKSPDFEHSCCRKSPAD